MKISFTYNKDYPSITIYDGVNSLKMSFSKKFIYSNLTISLFEFCSALASLKTSSLVVSQNSFILLLP